MTKARYRGKRITKENLRRDLINLTVVTSASGVYLGLMLTMAFVKAESGSAILLQILILTGASILLNTFYSIAHESIHRILFSNRLLSEIIGTLICIPLGMSFSLVRLGHLWHHRVNRGEKAHYPMDDTVLQSKNRLLYHLGWYFFVFLGGNYLVATLSVLPVCFLSKKTLMRFSDIFASLNPRLVWRIRGEFAGLLLVGVKINALVGNQGLFWYYLLPMLAFGILWSMLQNVYHYDTTVGVPVHCNARNVPCPKIIELCFLNFNYHLTHHSFPGVPWYRLPRITPNCPPEVIERNNDVTGLLEGILMQREGPAYNLIAKNRNAKQKHMPGFTETVAVNEEEPKS